MPESSAEIARIRTLAPLSRLLAVDQDAVLSRAMVLTFSEGEIVYAQGREDEYANYLLEGTVDFLWNGRLVKSLDAAQTSVRRALDGPGAKRYTVRARTWCTVLRIERSELERKLRYADLSPGRSEFDVSEITSEEPSSWMIRMLQSQRFANLPAENIQRILDRMERITVAADEVVIKQGDPGGYYYVIEEGYCDVTRERGGRGPAIHLAELGPGDAFGEEALVGGAARNATVTTRTEGILLRLDKESFVELIREPLVKEVGFREARQMVDDGAVWLDIRQRDQYAAASFANAKNVPAAFIRAAAGKLVKGRKYIVCGENLSECRVATFLLAERGYDVSYLAIPLRDAFATHESLVERRGDGGGRGAQPAAAPTAQSPKEPAGEHAGQTKGGEDMSADRTAKREGATVVHLEEPYGPAEPAPRHTYADTVTGERLADLVDEINARYERLAGDETPTQTGDTLIDGILDIETLGGEKESFASGESPPDAEPPPREQGGEKETFPVTIPEDEIAEITRDMELKLRRCINAFATAQRLQYEELFRARIAELKRAATQELHRKAQEISDAYRAKYERRERALHRHYQRLVRLANKFTRQKAEIQKARKELEEKLTSADSLYREVEQIRRVLKERIGNLDTLDRETDEDSNRSAS